MFNNDDLALILEMQTRLTDAAQENLGNKEAILLAEQLMTITGGTIYHHPDWYSSRNE